MLAKYLWEIGSLILVILGAIHIFYTFFSNKFSSKNKNLISEMKSSSPILTKETTMWRAWIGFNASHSSGVIFIGILNFFLAIKYFTTFQSEHFFFIFNILTIAFYVWLAKKFWFRIPFIGISLTFICYVVSYCLILFN
jgi:hypothetical protein